MSCGVWIRQACAWLSTEEKLKAENWLKLFTTAGQRERPRLPRDHVFYGPGSFLRVYLATPAEEWGSHEEKVVWARAIGEDSQCILFPSGMAQGGGPLGEWEVESLKKPQKYIVRRGSTGALIAAYTRSTQRCTQLSLTVPLRLSLPTYWDCQH